MDLNTSNTEKLVSEKDAAAFLKLSLSTLQQLRLYEHRRPKGMPIPPHIKIGRSIRYRLSDLVKWAEGFKVGGVK